MKSLSVLEAAIAPTQSNRQERKKAANDLRARGKNWIVLNVEPIASAFKANVLHPVKTLITPID